MYFVKVIVVLFGLKTDSADWDVCVGVAVAQDGVVFDCG